ncbi:MAG: hypothetical protein MJA83_00925 [Gammaproteobacteria bacterium]|nr:hypothetical protein [Gammaproteobacteria bacterium]
MRTSAFMPRRRPRELQDYGVAVEVFEEQLRLAGYRIAVREPPALQKS